MAALPSASLPRPKSSNHGSGASWQYIRRSVPSGNGTAADLGPPATVKPPLTKTLPENWPARAGRIDGLAEDGRAARWCSPDADPDRGAKDAVERGRPVHTRVAGRLAVHARVRGRGALDANPGAERPATATEVDSPKTPAFVWDFRRRQRWCSIRRTPRRQTRSGPHPRCRSCSPCRPHPSLQGACRRHDRSGVAKDADAVRGLRRALDPHALAGVLTGAGHPGAVGRGVHGPAEDAVRPADPDGVVIESDERRRPADVGRDPRAAGRGVGDVEVHRRLAVVGDVGVVTCQRPIRVSSASRGRLPITPAAPASSPRRFNRPCTSLASTPTARPPR